MTDNDETAAERVLREACKITDFTALEREQARALIAGEGFWKLVAEDDGSYLESTDGHMYQIAIERLPGSVLHWVTHLMTKTWALPHINEFLQALQFLGVFDYDGDDVDLDRVERRIEEVAALAGDEAEVQGRIQLTGTECRRLLLAELRCVQTLEQDEWRDVASLREKANHLRLLIATLDTATSPFRAEWNGFRYYVTP